jgi:hypothetical protein
MAGPAYYEGMTATNPQSGATVVLKNGQWVPTGQGGVMPEHPQPVEEALTAQRGAASSARNLSTVANRFLQENYQRGTGGIGTYLGGGAELPFGMRFPQFDRGQHRTAMEGMTSYMLRQSMVPGQSRSMDSNKEMEMTLARLPNVNTPGPTNKQRVMNIQQEMFVQTKRLDAMEWWAKQHQSMDGFEQAWTETEPEVRKQFKFQDPGNPARKAAPAAGAQQDNVPVYDMNGNRIK